LDQQFIEMLNETVLLNLGSTIYRNVKYQKSAHNPLAT